MMGEHEPVSDTEEGIWHHNYTIIVSLSLLVISCGSCCCFRNYYRVRTGRVGYFIVYVLAAISLVFQYLLLSKLIAQDKFISYDDVWHETLKLSPPAVVAPTPPQQHWNHRMIINNYNFRHGRHVFSSKTITSYYQSGSPITTRSYRCGV